MLSCDDKEVVGMAVVDTLVVATDGLRSFIVSGARTKSGIGWVNEMGDGMVEMDGAAAVAGVSAECCSITAEKLCNCFPLQCF